MKTRIVAVDSRNRMGRCLFKTRVACPNNGDRDEYKCLFNTIAENEVGRCLLKGRAMPKQLGLINTSLKQGSCSDNEKKIGKCLFKSRVLPI